MDRVPRSSAFFLVAACMFLTSAFLLPENSSLSGPHTVPAGAGTRFTQSRALHPSEAWREYPHAWNELPCCSQETDPIPVGTYTGVTEMPPPRQTVISFSIVRNEIVITVEEDGTTRGERFLDYNATQNGVDDAPAYLVSEWHEVYSGTLQGSQGELAGSLSYHFVSSGPGAADPQDVTMTQEITYHVQVSGSTMTLTNTENPDEFGSIELTLQSSQDQVDDTAPEMIPPVQGDLPDWVTNGQAYINGHGEGIYVPGWLDWIKPKPVQGSSQAQAVIQPRDGENIWIYSRAARAWKPVDQSGQALYSGDIVMAGPDSNAAVYMRGGGYQDTILVADEASLRLPMPETETEYPTLWNLYYGAVRVKREFMGEQPVQVHPPFAMASWTTAVGARSEFIFVHDPAAETSRIFLIEGEIDYYNLAAAGPDAGSITTGQELSISQDGTETILPFDTAETGSILAAHGFPESDPLSQDEIDLLFSGNTTADEPGQALRWVILSLLCIVFAGIVIIGLVIFFAVRRKAA